MVTESLLALAGTLLSAVTLVLERTSGDDLMSVEGTSDEPEGVERGLVAGFVS